jgi:calcium-dependent protein kinase
MINKSNFVGQFITDIKNYYNFTKSLGSGAFGEVFQVQHKLTGEFRACKRMNKRKIVNKERFKTEIELLKSTDHPHVIKLYEIFEDQVFIYLIMEECIGGDFFERIVTRVKAKKLFTEKEAAALFRQILLSVSYCHAHGVCHRDIKPENILFVNREESSSLKLIDFGLSKVMMDNKLMKSIVGTPYYMAPEVIKGEYDTKCDVWSCGVLLYIMLSGRQPFFGKSDNDIILKIKNYNYSFNFPEWQQVSEDAKELIKAILVKPEQRPTAQDILQSRWVNELAPNSEDRLLALDMSNCVSYGKLSLIHKSVMNFIAFTLKNEETNELAEIYKSFDNNGDGVITFNELKNGILILRNKLNLDIREKDIDELFVEIDVDRNGMINYTEFIASTISYPTHVKQEQVYEAFRAFDSNFDGLLTLDEFALIIRPQTQKDLDELQVVFKEFDENGDGQIDFDEFMNHLEKGSNADKININDKIKMTDLSTQKTMQRTTTAAF